MYLTVSLRSYLVGRVFSQHVMLLWEVFLRAVSNSLRKIILSFVFTVLKGQWTETCRECQLEYISSDYPMISGKWGSIPDLEQQYFSHIIRFK